MACRTMMVKLALLCLPVSMFAATPQASKSDSTAKSSPPPVTATDQDNGKDIDLTTGGTLVVKLKSNPSTGYSWTVAGDPSPLRLQKSTYVKNSQSSKVAGAPGMQVLRFTASSAGMTNLTLVYRRSWEYNVPPAKSLSVRVNVR
ncbi:MAG: protease inhibitor I42 family protein [Candidatus Korobacteraceae bacterium]